MNVFTEIDGKIKGKERDILEIKKILEKRESGNENKDISGKYIDIYYIKEDNNILNEDGLTSFVFSAYTYSTLKEAVVDKSNDTNKLTAEELKSKYPSISMSLIGINQWEGRSERVAMDNDGNLAVEEGEFTEYYFDSKEDAKDYGWEKLDEDLIETPFYRKNELPNWITPEGEEISVEDLSEDDKIVMNTKLDWGI